MRFVLGGRLGGANAQAMAAACGDVADRHQLSWLRSSVVWSLERNLALRHRFGVSFYGQQNETTSRNSVSFVVGRVFNIRPIRSRRWQ
jgi:hypothetical protein